MCFRYLCFVLFIWCAALGQTNYYVDSDAGSDTNSGLSGDVPWRSVTPCNSMVYMPGDSLFFKRGGSWSGSLRPQGSGSMGNPVVITAYGSGAKPVLDATGGIIGGESESATIRLYNQEHWVIRDLDIRNYHPNEVPRKIEAREQMAEVNSAKFAILIEACDYGTVHNLEFFNLDICRVNGDMSTKDNGGIFLNILRDTDPAKWTKTRFDHIMVANCHFYDLDRTALSNKSVWEHRSLSSADGDSLDGGYVHDWYPSTNMVVRSNLFERSGANALIVRVADAPLIEKNLFSNCAIKGSGNACFPFNCDNALIQYNESRDTYYNTEADSWDGKRDADAGGFDSDYNCKNTVIQYNYSHNNGFGGVLICSMGGGNRFNDGTVVRYNIFQNNRHHVFRVSGMTSNTRIYNNIVYTDKDLPENRLIWHKNWRGYADSTYYVNNIFINNGERPEISLEESSGNIFSHNVFQGQAVNGQPEDQAAIFADARLTAAGTGENGLKTLSGYRLLPDSPAIGTAFRFADHATLDFWGVPISPYEAVDRGAGQIDLAVSLIKVNSGYEVGFVADIPYLGPERSEKLDIYYPDQADAGKRFPAVIMIHGGGWVGGDKGKKREKNIGPILARHGYVCLSINYKLIDQEPVWQQTIADCKNAVKFARFRADEYRINPEKIGVIGGSAGGYLALMVGLTDHEAGIGEDGLYPGISARVQAVVDMYGKGNLLTAQETDSDGYPTGVLKDANSVRFLGGTRDEIPDIWKKASPINHISADDPPVIILHGRRDKTNDYYQAVELARALKASGVENYLYLLPNAGHTFSLQYDARDKPLDHDLSGIVLDFFNRNLK